MDVDHLPGAKCCLDPDQKTLPQVNLDWSPLTPAAILPSLIRPNCKSVGCRREVELLEETDAATAEHTASFTNMHAGILRVIGPKT